MTSLSFSGYIFTSPRSLKTGAHNQLQLRRFGELDAGEIKIIVTFIDGMTSNESIATEKTFEVKEGKTYTQLTA